MDIIYVLSFIWKMINMYVTGIFSEICYKNFANRLPLTPDEEEDVKGQVIVITGANRGIGKQIALEMAKRNATVVFGCRDVKRAEEAVNSIREQTGNNNLDLIELDLMDMDSVQKFASQVSKKYPSIKLLVNNAGVPLMKSDDHNEVTKDGFNTVVAANHLGHFLLTNLLLPNLRKGGENNGSARVVSVTSFIQGLSILDTNDLMMRKSGFGVMRELPYANTKHANSLMAKELAKRMKKEGSNVYAYSVCPGTVKTEIHDGTVGLSRFLFSLTEYFVGLSVAQAVTEYLIPTCLAKNIGAKESGSMYRHRKPSPIINAKLNAENELAEKLWDLSCELVKLDERIIG